MPWIWNITTFRLNALFSNQKLVWFVLLVSNAWIPSLNFGGWLRAWWNVSILFFFQLQIVWIFIWDGAYGTLVLANKSSKNKEIDPLEVSSNLIHRNIQQMYILQIRMDEEDVTYLRILWRVDPNQPIRKYGMTRLTFGTNYT